MEQLDERLPYPWCVKVNGGTKSPLKVHGRGLYTHSTELRQWIETRGAPAIVYINRAFDGTDANPRREKMAEEIVAALRLLDPSEVPAIAIEHVTVAEPTYRDRLVSFFCGGGLAWGWSIKGARDDYLTIRMGVVP